MDFDDTPDEAAYRARVRSYLTEHASDLAHAGDDDAVEEAAQRRTEAVLQEGGLVAITWPTEYGGQGGTPMQQAIVNQELARAGVPDLINSIGIGMCGPTVIYHGSDDQKSRYLVRLLRADDVWCQLFSEPGAGSDLAGLRTSAVRDGDEWVVNGQKVWTTGAQFAQYGILLTRTAPELPKHKGLTMFVVDMTAPGVTVRPLRQMSGGSRFNEVFFDDVRIPDSERLGEVNDGWRVALTTLMHERGALGADGRELGIGITALTELAVDRLPNLTADEQVLARQAIGRAVVESLGNRYTGYRRLSVLSRGGLPGPEASAGKLAGTRAGKLVADAGVRLLGPDAVTAGSDATAARWQGVQAGLPGYSIAGGTDEILKNVIGERVLGLPAEPRLDKSGPFRSEAGA